MGHPQKFVGALLHNAFQAGDKPFPKAKLPLAFLDHPMKFPIDSRVSGVLGLDYRLRGQNLPRQIFCVAVQRVHALPNQSSDSLHATGLYPRIACC